MSRTLVAEVSPLRGAAEPFASAHNQIKPNDALTRQLWACRSPNENLREIRRALASRFPVALNRDGPACHAPTFEEYATGPIECRGRPDVGGPVYLLQAALNGCFNPVELLFNDVPYQDDFWR